MSQEIYEEIRAACLELEAASGGRIRLVSGEADESEEAEPEAHEFLELDGKRITRDLPVYRFMAKLTSPIAAIADFAPSLILVMDKVPQAFEAIRGRVGGWAVFSPEEVRDEWLEIWGPEEALEAKEER